MFNLLKAIKNSLNNKNNYPIGRTDNPNSHKK